MKKKACAAVFALYILVVLYLTIFRFNFAYTRRQVNLTLFIDLINVLKNVGAWEFLRLFLGNIGWFVPFGFLLPFLLKKRSFWLVTGLGMLFSLCIEVTQYATFKGVAELDDLILNTIGTAIGQGMAVCFERIKVRWKKG